MRSLVFFAQKRRGATVEEKEKGAAVLKIKMEGGRFVFFPRRRVTAALEMGFLGLAFFSFSLNFSSPCNLFHYSMVFVARRKIPRGNRLAICLIVVCIAWIDSLGVTT